VVVRQHILGVVGNVKINL